MKNKLKYADPNSKKRKAFCADCCYSQSKECIHPSNIKTVISALDKTNEPILTIEEKNKDNNCIYYRSFTKIVVLGAIIVFLTIVSLVFYDTIFDLIF